MGKDEYLSGHNCLMGGVLGDERATVQLVGGGLLGIKTFFYNFLALFGFMQNLVTTFPLPIPETSSNRRLDQAVKA